MRRNGTHGGKNQKKVSEYYSNNFYVTTSGHFHSKAMIDSMSEIGVDRVLFSIDYPYEYTEPATTWFDNAPIAENDRIKIGRENAHRRSEVGVTQLAEPGVSTCDVSVTS